MMPEEVDSLDDWVSPKKSAGVSASPEEVDNLDDWEASKKPDLVKMGKDMGIIPKSTPYSNTRSLAGDRAPLDENGPVAGTLRALGSAPADAIGGAYDISQGRFSQGAGRMGPAALGAAAVAIPPLGAAMAGYGLGSAGKNIVADLGADAPVKAGPNLLGRTLPSTGQTFEEPYAQAGDLAENAIGAAGSAALGAGSMSEGALARTRSAPSNLADLASKGADLGSKAIGVVRSPLKSTQGGLAMAAEALRQQAPESPILKSIESSYPGEPGSAPVGRPLPETARPLTAPGDRPYLTPRDLQQASTQVSTPPTPPAPPPTPAAGSSWQQADAPLFARSRSTGFTPPAERFQFNGSAPDTPSRISMDLAASQPKPPAPGGATGMPPLQPWVADQLPGATQGLSQANQQALMEILNRKPNMETPDMGLSPTPAPAANSAPVAAPEPAQGPAIMTPSAPTAAPVAGVRPTVSLSQIARLLDKVQKGEMSRSDMLGMEEARLQGGKYLKDLPIGKGFSRPGSRPPLDMDESLWNDAREYGQQGK